MTDLEFLAHPQWRIVKATAGLVLFSVLLYLLRSVLTPFLLAFIIAYLLDPLVDRMERWKLPRTAAILILLLIFLGGLAFLGLLLFPLVKFQAENLIDNIPRYAAQIRDWTAPLLQRIPYLDDEKIESLVRQGLTDLGTLPVRIAQSVWALVLGLVSSLIGFVLIVINALIVPVAAFYFLKDIDRLRSTTADYFPKRYKPELVALFTDIDRVLGSFIRGQLIVALILAVLLSIGLLVCGTPMGLLIGVLAGLANIVPYLAIVVGLLPASILTYLQYGDLAHPLGVVAVFSGVQLVEGMFITPRVMGESVGLHPVAIMLAVLVGGEFFGFTGILFALPLAAVIKVFAERLILFYKTSEFFLKEV